MTAEGSDNDQTRSYANITPGVKVSHYTIVSRIGSGGMGEVFLAEDTRLERKVALKFLPQYLSEDEASRSRFTREAKAAARLDHPNIIQIYEVGEFKSRPFFAMAHVEGRSLREVIKEGKISIAEAVDLTGQMCEGLSAAHNAGIIHRDIKPSNIIIDLKGNLRILDFGLATLAGEEKLTRTGSTLGTVGYMSPEQVEGKEVDHRSDIFSVGVILYEMLTGRRPFEGDNDAAVARAIADSVPEPIARYKSGATGEIQQIIDKALSKKAALRYQHADEMLADLRRLSLFPVRGGSARKLYLGIGAVLLLAVSMWLFFRYLVPAPVPKNSARKMLVVLPFENLGAGEDEYFADGITDEITSRFVSVSGLGVISRTSAVQYKNTEKDLLQIARELGVDYVLEGTIRWDKSQNTSRVRITPQLISASDNTHLWADNYERDLTQIFEVQAEIAAEVVNAIGVTLGERERDVVESKPTDNLEAYDLYLRGRMRSGRSYEEADFREAITLLTKAVEYDPDFVEALAVLAYAYIETYYFRYEYTDEQLRLAKETLDRASRLDPNHPDVIFARALYYYHCLFDYDAAMKEIEKLIALHPNRVDSYSTIAAIKRRQGKWDEAIRYHAKADSLNPRDAREIFEAGSTYDFVRDYQEAERHYRRAISLAPDVSMFYEGLAILFLDKEGDVGKCRRFLEEAKGKVDAKLVNAYSAYCDICDRSYDRALEKLKEMTFAHFEDSSSFYRTKGMLYKYVGDLTKSRAYYDTSLQFLMNQPPEARDSFGGKISVAMSLAGLGRKQEAIKLASEAVELRPIASDAVFGSGVLWGQAIVLMDVGEQDKAIEQLDYLLSIPGWFSVNTLKIDPRYDQLRGNPKFKAMIEKYSR